MSINISNSAYSDCLKLKLKIIGLCRPLDAERQSSYTLTVSAVDAANVGMRKQSSAKVSDNSIH